MIEVIHDDFQKPIYNNLFVRIEIFALEDFGKQGLLVDDLSLTILKDWK